MMKSYIISVNSEIVENSDNHSHNSLKYKKRREYIKESIIPILDFCDVEIFDAITPDDFEIDGDKIIYKNKNYKRGIDWNSGTFPNIYLNSITLTSYQLYKKSLYLDQPIMILQDDLYIPDENIENIKKSIDDFLKIESPAILYLQSECPWMDGLPIRKYPKNILTKVTDSISIIDKNWYDLAGNVGYVINKKGSEKMIQLIDQLGLSNDDQLTTICMKNDIISVYISSKYDKMILLNKKLQ